MKLLVLLHRWLGVGFCLLFAMWFASGIVMHFVPFPSLTETERFEGLLPIDAPAVQHDPNEAVAVGNGKDTQRIRLIQRADGPVYILSGSSKPAALHAADLSNAAVTSETTALAITRSYARQRGLDAMRAVVAGVADYDQWTVPNGYDDHRPLYRIALNDSDVNELYVSSATGEIVLGTTRYQRQWNYPGSVVHWIYPTILRSHWSAWDRTVWTLSLLALVGAVTGVALGIVKLQVSRSGFGSPFRGWHAWHHILGLLTATFVLTWIFSGWLSMDHGRLFSRGRLTPAEAAAIARTPDWATLRHDARSISSSSKEVEWFAFDDGVYKRERYDVSSQSISEIGSPSEASPRRYLTVAEVGQLVRRLAPDCAPPFVVSPDDSYPVSSSMPDAPVYRSICGDVWFQIDGGNGAMLERLDGSRRAYRWAYTALHTLDFPVLSVHPVLRGGLIVALCAMGFMFSMTGAVIGWRRLRFHFPSLNMTMKSKACP